MTEPHARLHIVEPHAGHATVHIVGDVDASNAAAITQQLDDIASRSSELTIDLTGVTYLDSRGLRTIQALADRSARDELDLKLVVHATDIVYRLLVITGLDQTVPVISPPDNAATSVLQRPENPAN